MVPRCTVAGAALTAPLPVTRTGRPASSSTSITDGSAYTAAGDGLGRLPGQGPSHGVRRWPGSARSAVTAGTHANASPGNRPPDAAGTNTCSAPASVARRATARAAHSSAWVRPPHRPNCTPSSLRTSIGSSRNMVTPAESAALLTQASSCQRARSTMAAADRPVERYHDRSLRSL